MKVSRILLGSFLVLALAACGNDSPIDPSDPTTTTDPSDPTTTTDPSDPTTTTDPTFPGLPTDPSTPTGSSISGTVTAPSGGDVSGTVVGVCPAGDCTDPATVTTTVDTTGAYSLTGLSSVQYAVIAIKDATGDGTFGNGDYAGVYSTDGTNAAPVTPPATNINITMILVDDGSDTPTTPEEPTTDGSISGTVVAPTGSSATGATVVLACFPTGDSSAPCDTGLSGIGELAQPGSYTFEDLAAGQYLMAAFVDADGDGDALGDADYFGAYPTLDTVELVSPPASGIDILVEAPTTTQAKTLLGAPSNLRKVARASLNGSFLEKASKNFEGFLSK